MGTGSKQLGGDTPLKLVSLLTFYYCRFSGPLEAVFRLSKAVVCPL